MSYLILGGFSYRLIEKDGLLKVVASLITVIVVWILYYQLYLKDVFSDETTPLYPYIVAYGIILGALNILTNVSFFTDGSELTLYLIIISVSFVIGDVLMSIYLFANPIKTFEVINTISHLGAYYFMLRFAVVYGRIRPESTFL
ncbi:hypothetical protein [Leptobacterium sp. I13]|uniref:hypothetical protein n=1 Tax=Leptobacterium meishanense TaxID=3128904 RepID=UPI0030EC7FF5